MNRELHGELARIAARRAVTNYSEIAPLVGLDMEREDDRRQIGVLLDEISTHEHRQGRPLLSAVVTHKDGIPGKGFFKLVRDLGLLRPGQDATAFWAEELKRVHDQWAAHDGGGDA